MSSATPNSLTARVAAMRIITASLASGVICFAAVAFFVRSKGEMPEPEVPLLTFIALGVTVASIIARVFVIDAVESSFRRRAGTTETPVETFWAQYQTQTIIGAALLEGPAFFLLIAFMLEGRPVAITTAVLLAAAMAYWHFASVEKVERWVAEQQELIGRERAVS